MKNYCSKRPFPAETAAAALPETSGGAPPHEGFPLPDSLILSEIFRKLELQSLCTLSCVCRTFRSLVSQSLSTLPSLDLSGFSPSGEILHRIVPKLRRVRSVTIDCLHLDDWSVISILCPCMEELNLLKGASLSYNVLASIAEKCPDLRIIVLELAGKSSPEIFRRNLIKMLKSLHYLEHLSIKVRVTEYDSYDLAGIDLVLPQTVKSLKLQPVNEQGATQFIEKLKHEIQLPRKSLNLTINYKFSGFTLLRLSLVLNVISDRLMTSITTSLPLLAELDLEDRPSKEPKQPQDLTNNGLQSLSSCHYLCHLSVVRSRMNHPASFKRINDLGILLLSESCGALESISLGGFSKVTDAGFSSLVHSCRKLKKLEIRNAPLLSDLAFHDIIGTASPLVELRLLSCNLVTSEAIAEFASSRTLEMLDTNGCRSIADTCLDFLSNITTLTSLNLGGADITDSGLIVLGRADLPLTSLCLRGCTRVSDRGIMSLFNGGLKIKTTLLHLDVGHMPGVSDRAIHAIIKNADSITELCMRYCFHVTDACLETLALGGNNLLQKLDMCNCARFSSGLVELLNRRLFRGLRWIGVGGTCLVKRVDLAVISGMRPWLTVCAEGCEVGCHDGWQFIHN